MAGHYVGWADDGTHPLSQANLKTLDETARDAVRLIETIGPLATAQASVEFAAIPQDFRALMIECATSTTGETDASVIMRINGASGASDYRGYMRYEDGAGSIVRVAGANNGIRVARVRTSTAALDQFTIHVPNYRSGSTRRGAHSSGGSQRGTSAAEILIFQAVGWRDANAAVTSIAFTLTQGSLAAGSVFSLYGLP